MNKTQKAIAEASKLKPPYSPDDLKQIRASFDLNQPDFARFLRVPLSSLRKWEQGSREIDSSTTSLYQAVLYMRKYGVILEWMMSS